MHLNAQRADNWVICEYRNKETNLRIEEAIKIGEFFFVLFDPNDFIMLLRNTFSTYPFLRGFNEEEYGLVSEVFRKAKQNAGNLVNWLYDGAEIRNAEKYVPKKRIRLFDSDHFIKNFFPEFASEDERYIIFKTNPYLWQGDEKTLLIKTSADDFFKADVYIAHYNGQTINISRTIIDLPHDFYKFCFIGKETGNSNKEIKKTFKELPGVDRWSISHNNVAKDIYLKSSAERTRVTDDTTLCIFQDKSDNEAVKIWTESDRDEDNILILQRFYFHSHNIDNLSDDLRKKFKRLSQISMDHIQTILRNSDMIKKAFEEADKTIQKHMSREEIAKSKELAQIMLRVDAYYDNYDEMFPRSIYDEIRGSATIYNFIRINEGFSVQEAVDQYVKAKESYNSIVGEYGNVITYGLAGLNLNAFFFEKTIIF